MASVEEIGELKKAADLYRDTFYIYAHWKNQDKNQKAVNATNKSIIKIQEKFKKIKREEQIARDEKTAKQEELPSQKKKQPRQPRQKKIKKQKK